MEKININGKWYIVHTREEPYNSTIFENLRERSRSCDLKIISICITGYLWWKKVKIIYLISENTI